MNDLTAKRFLTIAQAQEALGVGRSTVYSLMDSGKLPSVKIGTARRIPSEELDRYMEALVTEAKGAAGSDRVDAR